MILSKSHELVGLCIGGREMVIIHSLHCEEVGEKVGYSQKVMLTMSNRLPVAVRCDSSSKRIMSAQVCELLGEEKQASKRERDCLSGKDPGQIHMEGLTKEQQRAQLDMSRVGA